MKDHNLLSINNGLPFTISRCLILTCHSFWHARGRVSLRVLPSLTLWVIYRETCGFLLEIRDMVFSKGCYAVLGRGDFVA